MNDFPPLPKSLIIDDENIESTTRNLNFSTIAHQFGNECNNRLDQQLMKLRKEMVSAIRLCLLLIQKNHLSFNIWLDLQASLKQLDLSLLSQLNALRESILEYKKTIAGFDDDGNSNGYQSKSFDSNTFNSNHYNQNSEEDITDDERETSSESKV